MQDRRKIRIFIVEDEAPLALNLQERLEQLGYEVPALAVSGEEALARVAELAPDLVLMDIRLSGPLDGVAAAELIRSRHRLPVIYLTAFADDETILRASRTEPFGYLLKPFRERELQTCIEMALYKHRAEERLRLSEQRYAATLHSIGDGLIATDEQGRIVLMNPVAEALTGWSQSDAAGRLVEEVFLIAHEETGERLPSPLAQAIREARPVSLANPSVLVTRDDRRTPIEDCATPILVSERVGGAVLVFRDVTERQRSARALRDSQALYSSLVEALPANLYRKDCAGRFTFANELFCRWLGKRLDEFLGQTDESFYSAERVRAHRQDEERVLATGETIEREEEHSTPTGGKRVVFLIEGPVRDSTGQVVGVQGIFWDITDRKRADEESRQLEAKMQHTQRLESLGILAGGIAHDFNNLLTGVLGYADLALRETGPAAKHYLEQIITGASRAADLTRQMLAYSGRASFHFQPMLLAGVVREMVDLLRISISKKVAFHVVLSDDLPPVFAEAGQLRQVLLNLILNAAEAIGDRAGVISVSLRERQPDRADLETFHLADDLPVGRYIGVEVTDTGNGMSADTMTRIFDPFFTTKFTGRGLGLSAVLGIVRGHKGAIRVTTELGRGTTFLVIFPVSKTPAAMAAGARRATIGGGTILVVDDEEPIRTLARCLLEKLGFRVLTAANGHEAIELFRANPEQVRGVVLDLAMPGLDGAETLAELKRIRSDVRVIACSGFGEQEARERFPEGEVAAFVAKPFRLEQLEATLHQILG